MTPDLDLASGLILDDIVPSSSRREPLRRRAQCGCQLLLETELDNYARRLVSGRSCLIAGPRGAGKTTLVQMALDRFESDSVRPLPVRIHGPSLLLPAADTEAGSQESTALRALRFLIIGLYQSAADCFFEALSEFVKTRRPELLELAAQLRVTLDGAPSLAALRAFWERAGALPEGVLFSRNGIGNGRDQAYRELVALGTAAEAYRSCTGEYTRERVDKLTADRQQTLKLQAAARTREFTQALMSLLSGAGVGAAAQASGASPLAASVAGALTLLGTLATLAYSSSRSAATTAQEEVKFLPRLDVSSLVHRTPVLIGRFLDAGLAPIFIIDELDKVPKLSKPLNDLVSQLKFICADEAFFCFLTDRAYLVENARQTVEQLNPIAQTIFTNRLFVTYDVASFHNYLAHIIRVEAPAGASDSLRRTLATDKEALVYILILRSRMLIFHLVAELREMRGPGNRLRLSPGEAVSKLIYQHCLLLQIAIEWTLLDPQVQERVRSDPNFGQVIYDALYYPVRVWFQGKEDLDISPDALLEGIGEGQDGGSLHLEENEIDLLYSAVRRLAGFVCEPARLKKFVEDNPQLGVSSDLCEAMPLSPLLLQRTGDDSFKWRYDRYGNPFQKAKVSEVLTRELEAAEQFILRMERMLGAKPLLPEDIGAETIQAGLLIDRFAEAAAETAINVQTA